MKKDTLDEKTRLVSYLPLSHIAAMGIDVYSARRPQRFSVVRANVGVDMSGDSLVCEEVDVVRIFTDGKLPRNSNTNFWEFD